MCFYNPFISEIAAFEISNDKTIELRIYVGVDLAGFNIQGNIKSLMLLTLKMYTEFRRIVVFQNAPID